MNVRSINKVLLVGTVGKTPEMRVISGSQKSVAKFPLATTEAFNKDGQWTDQTEWHSVIAFGQLADIIEKHVRVGEAVVVEGKIKTNKWQDKDGNNRYTTEIMASEVTTLTSRAQQQQNTQNVNNNGNVNNQQNYQNTGSSGNADGHGGDPF